MALLSKNSVRERGDVTKQIRTALEVVKTIPGSMTVYFIPSRLDDCDIPFEELGELQRVDMFPDWEKGLGKILRVMKIDSALIKSVITHQRIISPFTSVNSSHEEVQTQIFKGEKQFFVGRQNYINQIIRKKIREPGSKASIVGPGGSGKSQLAFKAIHQYFEEGWDGKRLFEHWFCSIQLE